MSSESRPEQIGPYRIEEQLGAGGMGEVYRAYDERLDRCVALKHIRPGRADNPKTQARFLREARAAARLNHPALVHVHDILETEDGHWIVMELVDGQRLDRLLDGRPLPPAPALRLAVEIASGLAAVHGAGILHRDLKSENVIVMSSRPVSAGGAASQDAAAGTTAPEWPKLGRARILDFGLAKPEDQDTSLSSPGDVVGTPRAMSPEQAQGKEVSHLSDLFALGTLLYEMFTGRSPFLGPGPLETMARICHQEHDPVRKHVPDIPDELSHLVDRLLAKDPGARPQSADEVVIVLERILRFVTGSEVDRPIRDPRIGETALRSAPAPPASPQPKRLRRSGERRQLTVVCCELVRDRGPSGEGAGTLDPETLYEVLPRFHSLVNEEISHYGGYLGDFQGHRLVVYFGYPQAYEDSARRAVLMALGIVERSRQFSATSQDLQGMATKAGIHTGPAVLVTTGPRERLALGRTLDLATRIQEQAPPGTVLISHDTRRLVEGYFLDEVVEPAGRVATNQGRPLHRVTAALEVHSPVEVAGGLPPPVAREREIGLLFDRFLSAREETGQVVLLSGEAGMGKTRLLRGLRDRLAAEPHRWLVARGSPLTRHLPLFPVAGLLRQLLVLEADDPSERRLARLREVLEDIEVPAAEVEPILTPLIDLRSVGGETLLPEQCRSAVDLLPELLPEIVESRPEERQAGASPVTVLVFECLQWADSATLELVGRLIDRCAAAPVLLLLTCRPEFQNPWSHRSQLTQLNVSALDDRQTEALIEIVSGEVELTPERKEEIAARAGGVPRYIEELTREAVMAESAGVLPGMSIPATLNDALTAGLDRLGTAKDLAQMAAAIGRDLSYQGLLSLWPLDEEALEHELGRLLDAEVLVHAGPSREGLRFRQPLLREAAWASLLDEDRRRWEEQIEHAEGGATQFSADGTVSGSSRG